MPVYLDKKTGRFFVKFDFQGETYKFRLKAGMTKKDGEKLETKKKSELFFESHGVTKRKDTLYEDFLIDVYLPFIEANRCKTTFEQAVRICKDSLQFFKGKTLRSFRPADIEKFKTHRMNLPKYDQKEKAYVGERRSESTVIKEISHLSKMFDMAVKNDECDYNPCTRVEKPQFDNVQNAVLYETDEELFYSKFESEWARDVSRVILNTGLRQNDILGLTKFQVDWQACDIVLIQGKTTRQVRIPMNETVQRIVREWYDKSDCELVFPSPKTGRKGTSIKTALKNACERAGIDRVGTRTLRRTFGTRLHELGYDDATIAGLLGHRDLRSVHRYKRGTAIKREAVNDLHRGRKVAAVQKKKAVGE